MSDGMTFWAVLNWRGEICTSVQHSRTLAIRDAIAMFDAGAYERAQVRAKAGRIWQVPGPLDRADTNAWRRLKRTYELRAVRVTVSVQDT